MIVMCNTTTIQKQDEGSITVEFIYDDGTFIYDLAIKFKYGGILTCLNRPKSKGQLIHNRDNRIIIDLREQKILVRRDTTG